jgi:hypothetical protein
VPAPICFRLDRESKRGNQEKGLIIIYLQNENKVLLIRHLEDFR